MTERPKKVLRRTGVRAVWCPPSRIEAYVASKQKASPTLQTSFRVRPVEETRNEQSLRKEVKVVYIEVRKNILK